MSFWSQERENALRIGVDRGLSASAIAALLGCSRNAVIGKARRSGMKLHGAALGSGKAEIVPERFAAEVEAAAEGAVLVAEPVERVKTLFDVLPIVPRQPICEAIEEDLPGVALVDLQFDDCRAINSNGRYCGAAVYRSEASWCKDHHARFCLTVAQAKRERAGRRS